MRRHIPNLLTLTNLFCGCCAFMLTLYDAPVQAAFFIVGSFVCDYLDGMVARALNVSGPLGRELDSLADVISFGAVPGAMLFMMLAQCADWTPYPSLGAASGFSNRSVLCLAALPGFILTAFSALRLAKFNLDTRQANYFIGLSTPACTVLVLGLMLSVHYDRLGLRNVILQPWLLYGVIALFSYLLVSEIPMFGMKVKKFDLKSNAFNLAFIGLFIILILFLQEFALTAVILCYILISIVLKDKVVGKM